MAAFWQQMLGPEFSKELILEAHREGETARMRQAAQGRTTRNTNQEEENFPDGT